MRFSGVGGVVVLGVMNGGFNIVAINPFLVHRDGKIL